MPLTTAGLLGLVLMISTVLSTWLAVKARQAERLAARRMASETEARQAAARAEQQAVAGRNQAQRRLFDARLAQAQASRWSGQAGRRFDALKALSEAAGLAQNLHLGPEEFLKLRNEAIASLALVDLRLDKRWEGYPPGTSLTGIAFDASVEHYARVQADGSITVRRVVDNQEIARIMETSAPSVTNRPPDWRMTLRFSRDGRFLAASGNAQHGQVPMQVWDLAEPRLLLKEEPGNVWESRALDFSSDSRLLAAGRPDGTLAVYEMSSGRELHRFRLESQAWCVRFNPKGDKLAVCVYDRVHILDQAGQPVRPPLVHPAPVWMVAWSADGQLVAAGSQDGQACVWDITTGKQRAVCDGHRGEVASVAFNPRGDLLATVGPGETTHLWEVNTGRELLSAEGSASDFSADARWLGLGLYGTQVGRWEVADNAEFLSLHGHSPRARVHRVEFSPDNRWLVSAASDGVRFWDCSDGRCVAETAGTSVAAMFDAQGRHILATTADGLYRYPLELGLGTAGTQLRLGLPERLYSTQGGGPQCASLSADGQTVAVGTGLGSVAVFEVDGIRERARFAAGPSTSLTLSPDGRWLVTTAADAYEAKLWDTAKGKWVHDFPGIRTAQAGFSPDNHWLVFATAQEYRFYHVGSWQSGQVLRRDYAGYNSVAPAFSADGKLLAIAYSARSVKLLAVEDGRELATFAPPVSEDVSSLCFSPDGARLAVGTGTGVVQLWDLRRIREELRNLSLDW